MRLESSLMERKKISSPGIGRLLRVLSARQPVSRRQAPAKLSSHARSKAANRGRARRYYPWDRREDGRVRLGPRRPACASLAVEGQAALDRLRAYPTDNNDGPALYLQPLIEREKKASRVPASAKPAAAPTKP